MYLYKVSIPPVGMSSIKSVSTLGLRGRESVLCVNTILSRNTPVYVQLLFAMHMSGVLMQL